MLRILFLSFIYLQVAHADFIGKGDGLDALYGHDERSFVDRKSSLKIKELSKSIALIVSKDLVEANFIYTLIKTTLLRDPDGMHICPGEKFADHHAVSSCTGFLIGEDLVASAGHCFISAEDCKNQLIAFNVKTSNEMAAGHVVFNQNIYECSEILRSVSGGRGSDYAVIRLKKKVRGATPLKLRSTGAITIDDQVFMIGHPLGLPLTITNAAPVNDISDPLIFKATLDSFVGNSGSPVFNSKTFEVEGILVRGEDDFYLDQSRQCNGYQVYDQGTKESPTIKGEEVTRIYH